MVDRAWLARLLRTPCADSTLLRTLRERVDVAANNLTRDTIGISSRSAEPTEKVREGNRVSALRVDRTVAQAQIRWKIPEH
jgi:putative ubiquitin-RnfH superfamily antitoxin RatB of RatAB toxin-antitoxin module